MAEDICPLQFDIGGMHCAACSSRIERVLDRLPGVAKTSVNLATARAQVWPADDAPADIASEIMARVAAIGFSAAPAAEDDSAARYEKAKAEALVERKMRLRRLLPMCVFTAILLVISMGHMLGMPLPSSLEPRQSPLAFITVQLLLTLPVVWLGRHFYTEGLSALWRRAPNMDSLVAVGTGAAFLYSLYNSICAYLGHAPVAQAMNLYYESCAVLLCMIEFGQFLEFTAKRKASDAMGALMSLAPETAFLLEDGSHTPREVPVAQVPLGARLLARPGSRIPLDGKVLEGHSAVDLSLLTGESMPVPVGPGSELVGGSVNGEGALVMQVTAVGRNTRLARIIRLVSDAQGSKAPIARLADRVSFYFVPAVMLFAALSALAWLVFSAEPATTALTVFVAVLVMACPCAMGLATPMSIMVGAGRGAQLGVLVKNGAALEQAARITTLCVDKTGTLTTGKPALTRIISMRKDGFPPENNLLALAASLEGRSEHPLGLAIIAAARERGCPGLPVADVAIRPGLGIAGTVTLDDASWRTFIGNEAFAAENGVVLAGSIKNQLEELAADGQTPLILSLAGPGRTPEPAAIMALADPLRPETPEVVARLQRQGLKVIMLTGDNAATARAVAAKTGITDLRAGLLPAGKAEFVESLRARGQVVGMVGDGLNDAPALAGADVGMAVGAGVDVSAEAGDIVLMRGGMNAVLAALGLSRATMRNIRQNLGWAFGYNILGLPVAAGLLHVFGGPMLSPVLAGTAMALSSFSVVTNALRLRWYGRDGI